jgi:hypothetical protein
MPDVGCVWYPAMLAAAAACTKARCEMKKNSIRQRGQSVCEHRWPVVVPARRPASPHEFAAPCTNEIIVKSCGRLENISAQGHHGIMNTLSPHISSSHKDTHDAHDDAVNPTTLGPLGHETEHTGRWNGKSVSDGRYTAAQDALPLKRRKLEMQVGGEGRQRMV